MPSDGLNVSGTAPAPAAPEDTSFADIMGFDAFTPSEPPAGGEQPAKPVEAPEGSEGQRGDAQIPPVEAGPRQTPQEPGQQAPSEKPDKTQETLTAILALLAQQRAEKAAQPPPPPAAANTPKAPKFNLSVPAELQSLIFSEDVKERDQGLGALVNGIANAVWEQVEALTGTLREEVTQSIPQTVQQHVTLEQHQANMRTQFFGEYPGLRNSEALMDLTAKTAQRMVMSQAAQGRTFQWNETFRDALAQNVYSQLGLQAPAPVRGGTPQAATPPSQVRQPFVAGRGTRSNGQAALSENQKDILETLGIIPFS